MVRWSQEDLAAVRARINGMREATHAAPRKYRNQPTLWQGQRFDSKHELRVYLDLKAQQTAGAIRAVIRQPSIPLPDSTRRARIDFLVIDNDGTYRWLDAKGFEGAVSKLKRQQLLEAYGIRVELC